MTIVMKTFERYNSIRVTSFCNAIANNEMMLKISLTLLQKQVEKQINQPMIYTTCLSILS